MRDDNPNKIFDEPPNPKRAQESISFCILAMATGTLLSISVMTPDPNVFPRIRIRTLLGWFKIEHIGSEQLLQSAQHRARYSYHTGINYCKKENLNKSFCVRLLEKKNRPGS